MLGVISTRNRSRETFRVAIAEITASVKERAAFCPYCHGNYLSKRGLQRHGAYCPERLKARIWSRTFPGRNWKKVPATTADSTVLLTDGAVSPPDSTKNPPTNESSPAK